MVTTVVLISISVTAMLTFPIADSVPVTNIIMIAIVIPVSVISFPFLDYPALHISMALFMVYRCNPLYPAVPTILSTIIAMPFIGHC